MLTLNGITKKYFDDKNECITALDNVDLVLPETGLVVITGTSGCGKTTLLNILAGLDYPTSGEVSYNGIRIDNQNEKWWDSFRGNTLGFIYQDFHLLENMSVIDNIKLPLNLHKLDEQTKKNRINTIVDELGLEDLLNKKATKLSGGQKQRVAIARALITGSRIILADEPTGNLDKQNSEIVFNLLKKIAKNRLVIVVTHDSLLANNYADRLIKIAYGTIDSDVLLDNNSNNNDNDIIENNNIYNNKFSSENEKPRLSVINCLKFAFEAMKQRKLRCFISVIIFSITMLFTLLLCEALFRDDSVSISSYINKNEQKVMPLIKEIPDEYKRFTDTDYLASGKNFYELISHHTDESRIIRYGGSRNISFNNENDEEANCFFASKENEKYFTYEGEFPENEDEVAVSKEVAAKFGDLDNVLGSNLFIDGKEYTITAVVTKICGKDVSNIKLETDENLNIFENVTILSTDALAYKEDTAYLYIQGFASVLYSDFFHQVNVYNYVCPINSELKLIEGRMPLSDNEIVISQSYLDETILSASDVLGKVCKLNNLYESKYNGAYWNCLNLYDYMGENFTIVGVVNDKGIGDYYVNASLFEKLYNKFRTYYEHTYYLLVDDNTIKDDIHNLLENEVKLKDEKLDNAYMFINNIDSIKIALVIFEVIIALLSVLQMISLYSYSISDNKKTIGILRTIGVNKSDTKKIFTVECLVISLFSLIIAIIANVFVTYQINSYINQNIIRLDDFNILRIRFVVVIIAGFVSYILSMLSVLVPLSKYSKIKIIEMFK